MKLIKKLNKKIDVSNISGTATTSKDGLMSKEDKSKLEDSGWIDMVLTSGFSEGSSMDKLQYRKIGNRVQLRGLLYLTGTMPSGRYFTRMPEGYRPKHNEYISVYYSGSTSSAVINMLGDEYSIESARGYIQASNLMVTSSSAYLSLNGVTYLTD